MRWQKISLIREVSTGEDVLGNPITQDEVFHSTSGRLTEWTSEDVNLLGRPFTESHRKLITKASKANIEMAKQVTVDGTTYEIESYKDLYRWRQVYVKGYRV